MAGFSVDSAWKIVAVEVLEGTPADASQAAAPDKEARP